MNFTIEQFPLASSQVIRYPQSSQWVVMAPGLGATIESSQMVREVCERVQGLCNIILIDYPGYGINQTQDQKEIFTLPNCSQHARDVIQWICNTHSKVSEIVCVGNSLGFWSLYQATQALQHPGIRIVSKSGIISYRRIFERLEGMGGVKNILKIGADGWGSISVNPGNTPVRIHANFISSIRGLSEQTEGSGYPISAFHGKNDIWTLHQEMMSFIGRCPAGSTLCSYDTGHGFQGLTNIDVLIAGKVIQELGFSPQ